MVKNALIIVGLICLVSLSSCGIFGKGCGCPHFGAIKTHSPKNAVYHS